MSFGNNRVLGSGAALQAPTRELRSTTHLEAQPMTAQKIFNEIVRKIPKIHDFTEIVYEGIEPEKGALVCDSLLESSVVESSCARVNFNSRTGTLWVRVMPTELHDVHHRWVFNAAQNWTRGSLMTPDEMDLLDFGVGTRFSSFTGTYLHSQKEPDLFLRPDSDRCPSVVIESGWSESWPRLYADRDLWMLGTTNVNVVMLLKWTKLVRNRVKGSLEMWKRSPTGGLDLSITPIFPAPVPSPDLGAEEVQLTKKDVFGSHMEAGQNPNAVLPLDMAKLRLFAQHRMAFMGLTPA
ncbi:hypothetical protein AnigIFM60653_011483 [Aspergillus niger]|nr:hypothetical protein BDQ94DRAFT_182652 [Aspergillus welwitschiae]GKZ65866.1 hypothetical protein AnigIFM50267_010223 [Aspergillus niger]RDH29142.1 hypothetical protein BDQ94DRAFT_182652 [Aspergillus welwitschiae]GLA01234.1 hypothetical protein AnigIFM60653_011483 [Aspergillus niger]GLA13246.1 hypothetical protein AnigIFM62618_010232 [Aspergillus niger]GLA36604.1 hypothetical protein AnigIFM63309_002925 [Aspergillus niger]